jgi:uncharacterized membrane protein YvbJ
MRCPKCGTENAAGRVLCVRCGARLRGAVARAAVASPEADATFMVRLRSDLRRVAAAAVVVAVVAATMGLLLR